MRRISLLFAISFYAVISGAQNVGVGTSSPQNKLHVAGGFRLDTLKGVGGDGLLRHDANGVVYGIKFTGSTNDVLRGDGTFAPGGSGGTSYWSANGTHIYNNNTGNVGIGTTTPGSGLELRGIDIKAQQRITDATSGNSLVLQGGVGGNLKVTGYNYTTGIAQPLYLSVDGANTFLNTNGGNVGIGTSSPSFTVDIKTPTFGGGTRTISNGAANFIVQTDGGTNSWARYYIRSTNRSWFIGTSQNFNGDQLYINDETAGQTRMVINTTGNVGIGTTNPTTRLTLNGGPAWTSNGWTASMNMQNASALGWEANASGQRFGIGQSNGGLFFFRTNSAFGNQVNPANYDLRITDAGNMTQNLGGYGLPKAMVYVNGDGTLMRCYNGITGATSCDGFSTFKLEGWYTVNFPFDITTRFFSVSVENITPAVSVSYQRTGNNSLDVVTRQSDGQRTDRPVMIIVY